MDSNGLTCSSCSTARWHSCRVVLSISVCSHATIARMPSIAWLLSLQGEGGERRGGQRPQSRTQRCQVWSAGSAGTHFNSGWVCVWIPLQRFASASCQVFDHPDAGLCAGAFQLGFRCHLMQLGHACSGPGKPSWAGRCPRPSAPAVFFSTTKLCHFRLTLEDGVQKRQNCISARALVQRRQGPTRTCREQHAHHARLAAPVSSWGACG